MTTPPGDRYGADVLGAGATSHRRRTVPEVAAEPGLVVGVAVLLVGAVVAVVVVVT